MTCVRSRSLQLSNCLGFKISCVGILRILVSAFWASDSSVIRVLLKIFVKESCRKIEKKQETLKYRLAITDD